MENKKVIMDVNMVLGKANSSGSGASNGSGTYTSADFICFNPVPDTQPRFLEHEASMLDVLNWIKQATYYIKTGFNPN